jgi:hypothetical protein
MRSHRMTNGPLSQKPSWMHSVERPESSHDARWQRHSPRAMVGVLALLSLAGAAHAQWSGNAGVNTVVCNAPAPQSNSVSVSDGAGGAIVAWADSRNPAPADIYVQRLDASGTAQWAPNGVAVCAVAPNDQSNPAIVSDGAGGAIVVWQDARVGGVYDIYAQRVNAAGVTQWLANGVKV